MAIFFCSYPFSDDQPIPFGWEEVLVELATEILNDPSPNKYVFFSFVLFSFLI
jgi:replication factor C subunit 3/5